MNNDRGLIEDHLPIETISAETLPGLVRIQNPAFQLDHGKWEIVATRYFEIAAEAVMAAGEGS
jgi:hypothetical protein